MLPELMYLSGFFSMKKANSVTLNLNNNLHYLMVVPMILYNNFTAYVNGTKAYFTVCVKRMRPFYNFISILKNLIILNVN